MTIEPKRPPWRWYSTAWMLLVCSGCILLAGLFVYDRLHVLFQQYDDEGNVLTSLAHYLRGATLYVDMYSQFGPIYYYFQSALLHLLSLPVDHDAGRILTAFYWIASSLLCGLLVARSSGSLVLGSCALLAAIFSFRAIGSEPNHPQQLVLLLYVLGVCVIAYLWSSAPLTAVALAAAIGSSLVFVKINCGVFFLLAFTQAVAVYLHPGTLRRGALSALLVLQLAAPSLLMYRHLPEPALPYCLLATVCGAAILYATSRAALSKTLPHTALLSLAAGCLSTAALVILATSLQGIPIHKLIEGVLLGPAKHSALFHIPLQVPTAALLIGGLTSLLALLSGHRADLRAAFDRGGPYLTLGVGILLAIVCVSQRLVWAFALLPLLVVRYPRKSETAFLQAFCLLLTAATFLVLYPVAGGQRSTMSAPLLLTAFLSIADGSRDLHASRLHLPLVPHWVRPIYLSTALIVVACIGTMVALQVPFTGTSNPSSGLSGSSFLRLPPAEAALYRDISQYARDNCALLYSLPGLYSFNFWSGVPTPNGWNLGTWYRGFDSSQQLRIRDALHHNPRSCAIYNRALVRFWGPEPDPDDVSTPLVTYILKEMPVARRFGDYELRVHPATP